MTTKTARDAAFKFFYANAGYSYDPKTQTPSQGKAKGARMLAKAERDAASLGYTFEWEYDPDGCIGCTCESKDCACSTGEPHETLYCRMLDSSGALVQSLGGICEPSREYRRVVEAELAAEELS